MPSAARAAIFASFSTPALRAIPHTAMTASPMNLSSVPSFSKTTATIRVRYSFNCATSFSGSAFSVSVVKPMMSENSIVAGLRTPLSVL